MGLFVNEDSYRPAAPRWTETKPTRADELIVAARGEVGRLQGFVRALCDDLAQYSNGEPDDGQEHINVCVAGVDCVAVTEAFDGDDGSPDGWTLGAVLVNGTDILPLMGAEQSADAERQVQNYRDARSQRDRADLLLQPEF